MKNKTKKKEKKGKLSFVNKILGTILFIATGSALSKLFKVVVGVKWCLISMLSLWKVLLPSLKAI